MSIDNPHFDQFTSPNGVNKHQSVVASVSRVQVILNRVKDVCINASMLTCAPQYPHENNISCFARLAHLYGRNPGPLTLPRTRH
jgi:hypothetical protein